LPPRLGRHGHVVEARGLFGVLGHGLNVGLVRARVDCLGVVIDVSGIDPPACPASRPSASIVSFTCEEKLVGLGGRGRRRATSYAETERRKGIKLSGS
jgi:hypothetical protein